MSGERQELLQRWLSAAGAPGLQPWQGLLPALSGSSLQQRSPPLMAIRLGLQLNKAFYEPGEPAIVTVKVRSVAWCPCARTESERACAACAPMRAQLYDWPCGAARPQISNDARVAVPGLVFIRELVFHASGQERSDPSWVGKLWRPECKPEATENRVRCAASCCSWVCVQQWQQQQRCWAAGLLEEDLLRQGANSCSVTGALTSA